MGSRGQVGIGSQRADRVQAVIRLHHHQHPASLMPQAIPLLCAQPSATSHLHIAQPTFIILVPCLSMQVMDALNMSYPDNSFDLVWACESGEHMPDKKK